MKPVFGLAFTGEDVWSEQKAIYDDEQTPEGWTGKLDDIPVHDMNKNDE